MAAATTILAASALALGAGTSASQIIGGAKQKRAAKRAAREFQRQELKNYAEGRQVSTLGATLAREEMARQTASGIGTLQAGGIRGVVGGMSAIQEANTRGARQIGAGLDIQQQQLDREVMTENQDIRRIQEQRDIQELNAIQSQMNVGQQMQQSGLNNLAQTAFSAAGMAAGGTFGGQGSGAAGSTTIPTQSNMTPAYSQDVLNQLFKVNNPVFTGQPINPVTGQPYTV